MLMVSFLFFNVNHFSCPCLFGKKYLFYSFYICHCYKCRNMGIGVHNIVNAMYEIFFFLACQFDFSISAIHCLAFCAIVEHSSGLI